MSLVNQSTGLSAAETMYKRQVEKTKEEIKEIDDEILRLSALKTDKENLLLLLKKGENNAALERKRLQEYTRQSH